MIANLIGFVVFFAGTYVASWGIDLLAYRNMNINVVINWSILIIFVSNCLVQCTLFLIFHCTIQPLNCSHLHVDQWFNNLTWYQSLVQASIKSCSISIIHQKQLSFHINTGIIALLPLNYVQRSLFKCEWLCESVHVEVERLETNMIANWFWFCTVICRYRHSFSMN